MALTTSDLHTSLAYRLGETSAPSDSTTKALRLEWFNQGYFLLSRRKLWWWLEATNTSNTNTGSTTGYSLPTDFRALRELKIGTIYYDQIPFEDNRIYQGTSAIVSLPQTVKSYKVYLNGSKYYLLPTDGNDGTTHTINYYKKITAKITDGGTFLIPDEFLEALVAYAEGRYWMSITQQAKAGVPFQEFEEIYQEMVREHNRRNQNSSGFNVKEPEDAR